MTPAVPADEEAKLQPVERGFVHVLRIRALLSWLPLVGAAIAADRLILAKAGLGGAAIAAIIPFALVAVAVRPRRVWRRLGYRLHDTLLQVVRGWLFHVDTLVPFVRVQHIDVTRGPLDKMFGTATLVVHTAGTHNSVVTLPGLAPDRAAEIRELIRGHIRSDLDER